MTPAIRGNSYAEGNSGGGAPIGNDNAVGHGAPEGNFNAAKHHGFSDPLKHYHRLGGEAKAAADEIAKDAYEDYALLHELAVDADEEDTDVLQEAVETHLVESGRYESVDAARDAFRTFGALYDMNFRTDISYFEDGFMVDREFEYETVDGETETYTQPVVNPAIDAGLRITSKRRSLREDLGIPLRDVTDAYRKQQREQQLTEFLSDATEYEIIDSETSSSLADFTASVVADVSGAIAADGSGYDDDRESLQANPSGTESSREDDVDDSKDEEVNLTVRTF